MTDRPLVPLGDLSRKAKTVNPAKSPDTVFEYYSIPAYDNGRPKLARGQEIGSSKKKLIDGDVLLSRIVPRIRRCWVVNSPESAIGSTEWIVYNNPRAHPNYLRHFLTSNAFHAQFMNTVAGMGGSLDRARPEIVNKIPIPLPTLDEQRRIARILDGTTHAINSAFEKRSALFKQLVATRFEHCFLQEERSWTTIGKYLESTQYGTSSKASDTGPTPILRMGNITYDGQLNFDDMKYIEMTDKEEDKFCLRDGDLLFNRTNSKELVGKTAIYRHDGVADMTFAGYLIRARTIPGATPEYISAYLNSRHGKATLRLRAKAIVGMANINASEFKTIPIPAASPEEQSQFAAFYKAAEEAVKMVSDAKRLGGELYNSLATRAFAGEL